MSQETIEVQIEEGAFAGAGFGPGINRPSGTSALAAGGGPEQVFAFLYSLMQRSRKRPKKRKVLLSSQKKRLLRMLQGLDAARTLQIARQNGQFS